MADSNDQFIVEYELIYPMKPDNLLDGCTDKDTCFYIGNVKKIEYDDSLHTAEEDPSMYVHAFSCWNAIVDKRIRDRRVVVRRARIIPVWVVNLYAIYKKIVLDGHT